MASKKVFIVHEDQSVVDELRASLASRAAGIEVVSSLSGPQVPTAISAQRPDVIVVDADLPETDGYLLTHQLKQQAQIAEVPVIIIAADPDEASALRARQAGAAAYLPSAGAVEAVCDRILAFAGSAERTDEPRNVAQSADMGASATQSQGMAAHSVQEVPPVTEQFDTGYLQPVETADHISEVAGSAEISVLGEPPAPGRSNLHIDDLLHLLIERDGSDLHLTVGSPPGLRLRGEIVPLEDTPPLQPRDTMEMIFNILSEEQRRRFETELELDFAYSMPGVSRFRANVFQQRNSMGAVFRAIPVAVPTIEELGLPKVCRTLADRPRGLVLVTGPTGSGKSTTLAAMIDHINETRPMHIVTLEDPIEFVHRNKKAYVNQREIGSDTHSFSAALKRVLRQDPDVILVGEMRDLETIAAAITAAETGHLVLATLHTTGGPATVDRIIDVFPPHQQQQVRMQLSTTLEGVMSQVLMRSTDGRTRVMAMEIMLGIPAISNLIREGKTHQMPTIIQGGASQGMQTLDQSLKNLLLGGRITFDEAISKAQNPVDLAQMVGRRL
ncbi:MAG: PilT/PilU family type 4a pilus ATPase [Coriobacteriia bacterium]|jgi:twitching motility protein PilT|nr:PilT/PilU family type 4a pilus ATPase [Coriobacteriia bacterium]